MQKGGGGTCSTFTGDRTGVSIDTRKKATESNVKGGEKKPSHHKNYKKKDAGASGSKNSEKRPARGSTEVWKLKEKRKHHVRPRARRETICKERIKEQALAFQADEGATTSLGGNRKGSQEKKRWGGLKKEL